MKLCLAVYHLLYIDVVARISLETSSATYVLYSLTELLSYKNGRMCICVYVCMYYMLPTKRCYLQYHIQGDSGGKVNIFGGDSIGHCERKKMVYVDICLILNGY